MGRYENIQILYRQTTGVPSGKVLQLKSNTDEALLIDTVLVLCGRAVQLPLPHSFTRRQALYELIRAVEDVHVDPTFPVRVRGLVPASRINITGLLDMAIFLNEEPMHCAYFSAIGYSARSNNAISERLIMLQTDILHTRSLILTQEVGLPEDTRFRHIMTTSLDKTLADSLDPWNNRVVFSVGRTHEEVIQFAPRLSAITWVLTDPPSTRYTANITGEFLDPVVLFGPVENTVEYSTDAYPAIDTQVKLLLNEQRMRSPVVLKLTLDTTTIIFGDCGNIGTMLSERTNIHHLLETLVCMYQQRVKDDANLRSDDGIRTNDEDKSVCVLENPMKTFMNKDKKHALLSQLSISTLMTVKLEISVVTIPLYLAPSGPEVTLGEHLQHKLANMLLHLSQKGPIEYMCDHHFSAVILNNIVMLSMDVVRFIPHLVKDLLLQVSAIHAREKATIGSQRYGFPMPMLTFNLGRVPFYECIEVPDWVQTLLMLPNWHAIQLCGASVTCDIAKQCNKVFQDKGASTIVFQVLYHPEIIWYALVQAWTSNNSNAVGLYLDGSNLWCITDKEAVGGCVRDLLELPVQVQMETTTGFFVGVDVIEPTDDALALMSYPYSGIVTHDDESNPSLERRMMMLFDKLVSNVVQIALGRHPEVLTIPALFPNFPQADGAHFIRGSGFTLIPAPERLTRSLTGWVCLQYIVKLDDVCSESMQPSVLSEIMTQMPAGCLRVPIGSRLTITVPVGTPLAVLNMVMYLQLRKCSCEKCCYLRTEGYWFMGSRVRAVHNDRVRLTYSHQPKTNLLVPIARCTDTEHVHKRVKECVDPEAARFLMSTLIDTRTNGHLICAMDLFANCSPINDVDNKYYEIGTQEMHYIDPKKRSSNRCLVRFVSKQAESIPDTKRKSHHDIDTRAAKIQSCE